MKVQSASASPTGVTPSYGAREVEAQRTTVSRDQMRAAIKRAIESEGQPAAPGLVDVLTAQACVETASGQSMYNFNFGGIKGNGSKGAVAVLRTTEVVGEKTVHVRDGFRAYGTIDEGARDFVHLVKTRFHEGWDAAKSGDVQGYAHALKKAHYYTANESDYARGLAVHIGGVTRGELAEPARRVSTPVDASSTMARVQDLLDADRVSLALGSFPKAQKKSEDESDEEV